MTTVAYPGSFDPFTRGHLDIVERAADLFEKVFVVVASNSNKRGFLTAVNRGEAIQKDVKHLSNVSVFNLRECQLLTDFIEESRVDAVVRGIRNGGEFDAESAYIENLNTLVENEDGTGIPSVFFKISAPSFTYF
jgi:pantetheine-phosphate adenylyltransferase